MLGSRVNNFGAVKAVDNFAGVDKLEAQVKGKGNFGRVRKVAVRVRYMDISESRGNTVGGFVDKAGTRVTDAEGAQRR
jgi:hypothetical protein